MSVTGMPTKARALILIMLQREVPNPKPPNPKQNSIPELKKVLISRRSSRLWTKRLASAHVLQKPVCRSPPRCFSLIQYQSIAKTNSFPLLLYDRFSHASENHFY